MRMDRVVLLVLLFLCLSPLEASATEKRVALVIGNSAYEHANALANPGNDARAIAKALRELNFEVIEGVDLPHLQMMRAIRTFGRQLQDAKVAVFYFAGHGIQVKGNNYLVPIDAKLEEEADVEFELIQLGTVLTQVERLQRTAIVILDACRDNPLARRLLAAPRSQATGLGLAKVELGIGTLMAFATAPGSTAADGVGRSHSPFTEALLRHVASPNLDAELMFRAVRNDVISATRGAQVPWTNSSLTVPVYFNPGNSGGDSVPGPLAAAPQATPKGENVRDYLMKNPEILLELQQQLEQRQERMQAEKALLAIKEHAPDVFRSASSPATEAPGADVTVVEFMDYNCGYCRRASPEIRGVLAGDRKIKLVMKEFPILSKGSEEAARVALAANMQGKYWEFHRAMYENEGQANEASALRVAGKLGLDMVRLKRDMASAAVKKELDDTRALASKMGVQGTPHFVVGDRTIPGAPENLADMLKKHAVELRRVGCKVC